jgi:hypothetical protein
LRPARSTARFGVRISRNRSDPAGYDDEEAVKNPRGRRFPEQREKIAPTSRIVAIEIAAIGAQAAPENAGAEFDGGGPQREEGAAAS